MNKEDKKCQHEYKQLRDAGTAYAYFYCVKCLFMRKILEEDIYEEAKG